ncbi:MAG: LacI family DNA-binding transcriptional regulator [Spirochaetales bacterium]|nr:LacI family DNA-binding transcriptional regulator [Spirochaetales bacterium]
MDKQKKITIIEIAKLANVSKGTVSKALNNKPGIGGDTRERILDIVDKLDFQPDSAARALSNQKTSNIGLVIPHEAESSLKNAYWADMISSITAESAKQNFNLMLFTPLREGALSEMYRDIIQSNKVDGLIIGSELIDTVHLNQLNRTSLPFVLIGQNPEFHHHCVDIDNDHAAGSMTAYMLDRGYNRIAYLSGPRAYYYNRLRINAYWRTMQERDRKPLLAEADELDSESISRAVEQLFSENPEPEGLFIGAGGNFLYTVLDCLKQKKIPLSRLGICVFDDYRYLDFMEPGLTAVRQPTAALGKAAVKRLIRLINNEVVKDLNQIYETSITERSSCPVINRKYKT